LLFLSIIHTQIPHPPQMRVWVEKLSIKEIERVECEKGTNNRLGIFRFVQN
jgi:hypothetical protein